MPAATPTVIAPETVRAVALDLDGTLAGADHAVSPRSLRALAALEARGVTPIMITGRTAHAAALPVRAAGLSAPTISYNGALVEVPATGERLLHRPLPRPVQEEVLALAAETGLTPTLWTATAMHIPEPGALASLLAAINDEPPQVGPLESVVGDGVLKAMLGGEPERLDAVAGLLQARLPVLMRSLDVFYETSRPEASKAPALALVLERLGVPPEACLGIGDGDTDVDWLQTIGFPVAVANARPRVRATAVRVIGHHADDGVAEFLEALFEL